MLWRKKLTIKKLPAKLVKEKKELVKPSPRRHVKRAKRIVFNLPCYLFVQSTDYLVQTTTVNISKSGILVKSLKPLETGQEVLCLISDKKNLSSIHVRGSQHTLKAKIVRVEKEEMLFKIALIVTLGRVNPLSYLGNTPDDKFWWTRHWQSMDTLE